MYIKCITKYLSYRKSICLCLVRGLGCDVRSFSLKLPSPSSPGCSRQHLISVAWRSELCTERSLVWTPRLAGDLCGEGECQDFALIITFVKGPRAKPSSWVPHSHCPRMGSMHRTNFTVYFQTCLQSSSRSVLNQLHSPPGWMRYYHLPGKLLMAGFRIRPVWSTKQQTPTVSESRSILLPILFCSAMLKRL